MEFLRWRRGRRGVWNVGDVYRVERVCLTSLMSDTYKTGVLTAYHHRFSRNRHTKPI